MHMIFINFFFAFAVSFLAHRGGVDPYLVAVIGWAAFRVEVAMGNQMAMCKLLSVLVQAESRKIVSERAQHEAHVAHIARNN